AAHLALLLYVPNFHEAIAAARDHITAVRTERDRAERSAVAGKRQRLRRRFIDGPDVDDVIDATGRQPATVRAKGEAAHGSRMAAKSRDLLAARQVPELDA